MKLLVTAGSGFLGRSLLHRVPVLPVPGRGRHLQPVHVADLARAVLAAVERPAAAGVIYDVADPAPLTFAAVRTQGAE